MSSFFRQFIDSIENLVGDSSDSNANSNAPAQSGTPPAPSTPADPPSSPILSDTNQAYNEGYQVGLKGGMPQCKAGATPDYDQAYNNGYQDGQTAHNKVYDGPSIGPTPPGLEIVGRIIPTFVD